MSRTRQLMTALRDELGSAEPLPPVPAVPPIPPPAGARVHAAAREAARSPPRPRATRPRCVGIGHVGTRYATDVVLQFQAELAVAHAAVGAELPDAGPSSTASSARSRVADHREFLLRPDLGRRLDDASLAIVRAQLRARTPTSR